MRRYGVLTFRGRTYDVKRGAVQIDKLKKKHFQGEAVLPLGLEEAVLWTQGEQRLREAASDSLSAPSVTLQTHRVGAQAVQGGCRSPSWPVDGERWNGPSEGSSSSQTSPNKGLWEVALV